MALIRRVSFAHFDRWGTNLGRLTVSSATHTEGLDGTDELKITCAEDIGKGDRIVWVDRRGLCHEHIVDEAERTHDGAGAPQTQATCINSIAELWDDWVDDKVPSGGVAVALKSILAGTRWTVGTCDQTGSASHKFYHQSVRESIAELLDTWGGELETAITHDGVRVTSRAVAIRAKRGDQTSKKRFTWTKDVVRISRKVSSDPKTRVYGYGKGVETDSGGYGRRLTFDKVNGGRAYVEDAAATAIWGHPDGSGKVAPATTCYINEQCEDASQLLKETRAYLDSVKEPGVTYEADVIDLYAFGRSWEGVAVGDAVTIIDKGFNDAGVRLHGRVSQVERDLLTADATVTFGTLVDAMTDQFQSILQTLKKHSTQNAAYDSAADTSVSWLTQLQGALNEQFNAVGTYKVETFELGSIYSNVPIDAVTGLPLRSTSGMWAVNINGMGIRLAASLAANGQWDWRTFFTGGMVTADVINAGTMRGDRIRAGLLEDEKGKNYWDLTNGAFALSATATVGGKTVAAIADAAVEAQTQQSIFNKLTNNGQTQGIYLSGGKLYINATYMATGVLSDAAGRNTWNLNTGALTTNYMKANNIDANGTFQCGTTSNMLRLVNGEIRGLEDGTQIGVIDFSAHMREVSTGKLTTGLQLTGNKHIRITTPLISVAAASDESVTTTHAITKECTFHYISKIENGSNGTITWYSSSRTIEFIDGLCIACNFD